MNAMNEALDARMEKRRAQNLFRSLRRVDSPTGPVISLEGCRLRNFSSNDYLGLACHPALKEAAARAAAKWGAGSGASRLISGSLGLFHDLEDQLAAFKKTEAALVFTSGYAAALGTIASLMTSADIIIMDKRVHACLVDASRLSGATLRVFAHNDMNELEARLKWARDPARTGSSRQQVLVITESVFSMDGDRCPLTEIVTLKNKFGAWLMVDEAHATGILGSDGRGLADALGLSDQVDIHFGTLGKALGSSGGFVCGSRVLVDYLVNHARSLIFSTAPVPAAAAAALAGLEILLREEGSRRRNQLFQRVQELLAFHPICKQEEASAIIPWMVGDEARAMAVAGFMRESGFFLPAIRYPTVARGAARLRITLCASHSKEDVEALITVLRSPSLPQETSQTLST